MMKKLTLGKNSTALMKSPSFLQRMLSREEDSEECSSDLDSDASAVMSFRGLDSDSSTETSARGTHMCI